MLKCIFVGVNLGTYVYIGMWLCNFESIFIILCACHCCCAADPCNEHIPSDDGYGAECANLVTDGQCTQTCTAGYSNIGDTGVMTCPGGVLNVSQAIICKGHL